MDVRHYFEPVDFSALKLAGDVPRQFTLGAVVEKNTLRLGHGNINSVEAAIVGAPFNSMLDGQKTPTLNQIRSQLYALAHFDRKINLVDFGNLKPATSRKGNYQALRDIIEYFNELQVATIIVGGSQDLSLGICDAFAGDPFFSLSTVDAVLDVKKGRETLDPANYLSRVFSRHQLFQFSLVGYQGHYVPRSYLHQKAGDGPHISLGELRNDFRKVEPLLRNTDFLSFDTGAIKQACNPQHNIARPNGLRSEEACQIARYAGLSNRLNVFGLFETPHGNDTVSISNELSAQIIWYFLEGYTNRDPHNTPNQAYNTRYQVQVDGVEAPVVFLKNKHTGQWWIQVETMNRGSRYFACSEADYVQAANNEIPALWLKYIQKTDETLK